MAKGWNRIETWLTLIVGGIGVVILAVAGRWIYVSATATPIHPNPQDVQSVADATAGEKWSGAVDQARQIVRAALSEQNLPGVSVAVGVAGEIVWAEGFGWADIDKQLKVAPNTRFRIGTASTALTSAAAGLLMEQGRLNLDDRIQKLVPDFPEKQWPITLRQVMAHVSGLTSDGGDEGPLFGVHCDRPVDAVKHIASRDLRFEPGTQYRFSNFGWILVSAAIEAAADEPFLTFMRKQIFEPLGMDGTEADLATEAAPDRATSYFPRFAADPRYGPDLMRELDLSCYAGASVFLSTPSDLVRFAMAVSGGKLLQPATVQLLQSSQRLSSGEETGYGLGWDLETVQIAGSKDPAPPMTARTIGHDGDVLGGTVASLMTLPDHGIVVSVVSNTSYADTASIGSKVAGAFVSSGSSR